MKRARLIAGLVLLVVAVSAVTLLLTRKSGTPLDPANPGDNGSEAVASVLADQGVRVHPLERPAALASAHPGADAAILVPRPREISADRLRALLRAHTGAARVILIAPTSTQLAAVFPGSHITGGTPTTATSCSLSWAHDLRFPQSSRWYAGLPPEAANCFGEPGNAPVFELPAGPEHPNVLVLGSANPLFNDTVTDADNAAIALRALGQNNQLYWYSGGFDPLAEPESVAPRWVKPAVWLLGASVLLLMFWRGRRLGKLVTEPLPVVVRANETTLARGQLYRKSRDSAAMARTLRAGTRGRLTTTLGLAPRTPPDRLVEEVARITGRRTEEVAGLLLDRGGDPGPRALPEFARELTALERQARRS